MHVEEAYATLHFCIILISLRVEMAQISDFLVPSNGVDRDDFHSFSFSEIFLSINFCIAFSLLYGHTIKLSFCIFSFPLLHTDFEVA